MNLTKQFFKYVSQNIFGLIGTSCYILADTYFIAQAAGTENAAEPVRSGTAAEPGPDDVEEPTSPTKDGDDA